MIYDLTTRRAFRTASALATVVCTCVASNAYAAWETDVTGGVESRYDDNVRLSTNGSESAVATNLVGELAVRRVTESSEVAAVAGASYLTYTAYDGVEDLQNEDIQYFDLRASSRADRTTFGFDGSVRRDVLLETVGAIVDPLGGSTTSGTGTTGNTRAQGASGVPRPDGVSSDLDAGSVEQQVRRVRTWASPYVSYQLSQQTGVQLGYSYLGLRYDDPGTTGLVDSMTNLVSLESWNQVTERDTARFGLRAARFDPDSEPDKTDAYEASVGWDREFSERVRASIELGGQRSERDGESDNGYLVRFDLRRRSDAGALRARYEHSLQPSGYGDLVESDTLDFNYEARLSNRLTFGLNARGYRVRNSSDQISNQDNDRDYVDIGPELTYALTEVFNVGAFYTYRWVDRESDGSSGTGNAVGVSISYRPLRRI